MKSAWLGFFLPLILGLGCEVVLQFTSQDKLDKAQQIHGVPAVGAQLLLVDHYPSPLTPLGGISNRITVLCRENSDWAIYTSDRYGFPNPDTIWQEPEVNLAFVGDSYFQGGCLSENKTFVNRFRENNSVINLSSFGHGPLAQLGLVLEYLTKLKPKKVIWSLVPNDLNIDLSLEMQNDQLKSYLELKSQSLMSRQKEIDQLYTHYIEKKKNSLSRRKPNLLLKSLIYQKYNDLFRREPQTAGYSVDYLSMNEDSLLLYKKILQLAKEQIESWRGQFYVVWIPDAYYFSQEQTLEKKCI